MAVLSVNPVWQGRDCDEAEDGTRTYTRVWRVVLEYAADSPAEAKAAVGVAKWSPYVDTSGFVDVYARAKSIRVTSDSELPNVYLVTVTYDTRMDMPTREAGGATGKGGANSERNSPDFKEQENPLLQPWQISGGTEKRRQVVTRAVQMTGDLASATALNAGAYVTPQNSAGSPFVPALEEDRCDQSLTIVRNVVNLPDIRPYINTINAVAWRGEEKWTVKLVDRPWSRKWHQACGYYYEESYSFAIRNPSWIREVLNAGLMELTVAGDKVPILDPYGNPVTEPVCLDEDGYAQSVVDPPTWRYYRTLNEANWGPLSLEAQ